MSDNNVVDLSTYRNSKNAEEAITFDSLSDEEKEQVRLAAEKAGITPDEATERINATTAFLVYIMPDGQVIAHHDLTIPLNIQRAAGVDDMYGAICNIQRDIQAQTAAMSTLNAQQQMMAAMAQAQQAEAIKTQLGPDLKNPGGFGTPPRRKR